MPSNVAHTLLAACGLYGLAVAAFDQDDNGNSQHNPLTAIGIWAASSKYPRYIKLLSEPASLAAFYQLRLTTLVGFGTKKICDWEPQDQLESAIRSVVLCAGLRS